MIVMPVIMLAPLWGLILFYIMPLVAAVPVYIVLLSTGVYFNIIMFWSMHASHETGMEALIGRKARVIQEIDPVGIVEIRGEIWSAKAPNKKITVGQYVKIVENKGLTLIVKEFDEK